jgi:hypothetical protein
VKVVRGDETYWTRPGRERVISATTNYAGSDLLKVFSTSTAFDAARTYSKFGAYALLNHGGDYAAAAGAIRREMPRREPARGASTSASDLLPRPLASEASKSTVYDRLKGRTMSTKELYELKPPEWLIDGVLPKGSLAVLWGQSGSYKSFLALDWTLCLATGSWWNKKAVSAPVDVFYIIAEGVSGIPKRVKAWSKHNKIYGLDRATWLGESVDILNDEQFGALCSIVAEMNPAFTVIDTLARSMPGADENSAQDMGKLIDRADQLKRLSGGSVLLVHHSTKEGSVARGSGSLRAAVDVEIEMKREDNRSIVYCRKQKDAAEFEPISLHLVTVDDSCVLSNVSRDVETNAPSSHALETVRRLYVETFSETGVAGSELRNVIEQSLPTSRASAYRLISELVRTQFIKNSAGPARPFYTQGADYYTERSSQRLTNVSQRLNQNVSTSQGFPVSKDGEPETRPARGNETEVQALLWSEQS